LKYINARETYSWTQAIQSRLLDLRNYEVIYITEFCVIDEWPDDDIENKPEGWQGPTWVDISIGLRNYNPLTWFFRPYNFVWIFDAQTLECEKADQKLNKKLGFCDKCMSNNELLNMTVDIDYFTSRDVIDCVHEFLSKLVPDCNAKVVFIKSTDIDRLSCWSKIKAYFRRLFSNSF